jgi:membrane protease YdiL (CAAX protease family)
MTEPTHTQPASPPSPPRSRLGGPAREALLAYVVATVTAAVLYRVPALEGWFHVGVAALFLYLPVWLLRDADLLDYGLTLRPLARNHGFALTVALVVFPPVLVGYALFARLACAVPALASIAPLPCHPGALLHGLLPSLQLHLPPELLSLHPSRNLALAEIVVVALPEETFFRAYLQTRLDEALPPRARFLGARIGPGLILSSALFAVCHLAVQGNAATLAVFFPSLLFGWMRSRSGSILPGVVFHAACNLYIDTLARSFLG